MASSSGEGGGIPAGADAPRYAAFISYSHVDERAANSLHRKLESYKLPPNVRGDDGSPRLGKIFRDRADLAAASSLTTAIRSALAQSAALIVLCSPEAKQSQWVDAEIRLFRELHPDASILSVILRGDPAEGMPLALTEDGREPLAADFRKEADGGKLGFLKVVAALKGVPLDSLIQRDAQRRLRRVTVITVVAFLLVIVLGTMTAFAFSAQREAERQRAEAEGLIEFMVTDLREGLRGVGRSDVMNGVNDRALAYYRDQGDVASLPDDSLGRRARVLHALGEDKFTRADLPEARRLFAEAYSSTEAMLRRQPDNPDRIHAHGQSEFWAGLVASQSGDVAQYERRMRAYDRLVRRLATVDPDRTRILRETGYAQGNLCTVEIGRGNLDVAELHCSAALAAQQRVLRAAPRDRLANVDVTNRRSWLASLYAQQGDHRRAGPAWDDAVTAARALIALDPNNRDSQDLLLAALLSRGTYRSGRGNTADGRRDIDEAASIIETLRTVDPANQRWQRLAGTVAGLRSRTVSQPTVQ